MGGGHSSFKFVCKDVSSSKSEILEKFSAYKKSGSLPDILILDLLLNGESGLDVLKEITEKYPEVKTLVYSMYENSGTVSLALEYGAKAYVCKTSDEKELLSAAQEILAGKTYVQKNLVADLFVYQNVLESLTKQESQVLKKVIEQKSTKTVSEELGISKRTVENYLSRIYDKTGLRDCDELIARFR